jgi:DNA gyrase subunit B
MEYTAESINVLKGLEAIRKRPDMYIGSPSGNPSDGLYRLCREILDNSIDEYLAGCNYSIVIMYDSKTHQTTVIDNGRGIPVGWNSAAGMNSLTAVVTEIHAGGKFDHEAYKTSSGKNGVGASAVNALSTMMQVWSNNSEDRKWYTQSFAKGNPTSEVEKTKLPEEFKQYIKKTGTIVTWLPDSEIFIDSINLNVNRLKRELHDIMYLCPKLNIKLIIDGTEQEFYSEKGLSELVSRSKDTTENIFTFSTNDIDVALNFTKNEGYDFKSYVNVCYTNLGGTHLDGFKKTILNIVKSFSKEKILNEDILEGMVGAIHCKVAEPQYQGQTKNELTNSIVETQVIEAVTPALTKWFKKNKAILDNIVQYAEKMLAEKQKMKASKALLKGISQLNTGARFISDKFLDADRRKHKDPKELECSLWKVIQQVVTSIEVVILSKHH